MTNWLNNYVSVLEHLKEDRLDVLEDALTKDVEFIDPFNHTRQRSDFIGILSDMYCRLTYVKFEVTNHMRNDNEAYILWIFYGNSKLTGAFQFEGVSLLKANTEGKVFYHKDIWDASVLMQTVPVLGRLISKMRQVMAHT